MFRHRARRIDAFDKGSRNLPADVHIGPAQRSTRSKSRAHGQERRRMHIEFDGNQTIS
jgi:hypothetical protein